MVFEGYTKFEGGVIILMILSLFDNTINIIDSMIFESMDQEPSHRNFSTQLSRQFDVRLQGEVGIEPW